MNRGIFGFPRSGALDARSVKAQTLDATAAVKTPGTGATSTGIKLVDDSDLGTLFRPASYTAVQGVSFSHGGGFGNANCNVTLSGGVSGNQLNVSVSSNCNCNCVCDCTSCP
jgi:hypothetical protein